MIHIIYEIQKKPRYYVLTPTVFPDKTSQVWNLPDEILKSKNVVIHWNYEHESELIHLGQLKLLLDTHKIRPTLDLKYLPYGRQDKPISNNATFGLHFFAKVLNSLKFKRVFILDPHSKEALKLIKNSEAYYPIAVLNNILHNLNINTICFPDNGAKVKYSKAYNFNRINKAYGEKVRDQRSGQIISYKVKGKIKDKNILIVDDIVDGGATFIELSKQLIDKKAKAIYLYTNHGLFTKGTKILFNAGIDRIFTEQGEINEPNVTV